MKRAIAGLLILGASFIGMAQADDQFSCRVSYYGVGGASGAVNVNPDDDLEFNENWAIESIEFEGNCDCTLTLYSKVDLAGCKVTKDVETESSVDYEISDIWKRSASQASFHVGCEFSQEQIA